MINKEIKPTCENCKYYLPHYVETKYGLSITGCGHCVNDNYYKIYNERKRTISKRPCEFYEYLEYITSTQIDNLTELHRISNILEKTLNSLHKKLDNQ